MPPKAEFAWWYQFYFAKGRGQVGYKENRCDFAKLIWQLASPKWQFDDEIFDRSDKALDNPDHVAITIHNYRWRIGLAQGDPQLEDLEKKLAAGPVTLPTITSEGDTMVPPPCPRHLCKQNTLTGSLPAALVTICSRKIPTFLRGLLWRWTALTAALDQAVRYPPSDTRMQIPIFARRGPFYGFFTGNDVKDDLLSPRSLLNNQFVNRTFPAERPISSGINQGPLSSC